MTLGTAEDAASPPVPGVFGVLCPLGAQKMTLGTAEDAASPPVPGVFGVLCPLGDQKTLPRPQFPASSGCSVP
ncbi:hypothetical protein QR680_010809 [Steinernema hermaphroditum]|nr:hypothetical protein QR680_010809 [Steinernema hermaphroditum]